MAARPSGRFFIRHDHRKKTRRPIDQELTGEMKDGKFQGEIGKFKNGMADQEFRPWRERRFSRNSREMKMEMKVRMVASVANSE